LRDKVCFGRGSAVNAARFCAIVGWTRPTFNRWVALGLPVRRAPKNKGGEYQIHAGEALEWLFDYAAQGGGGAVRRAAPPPLGPGMEMLEGVRDPMAIAFALAALSIVYELPRLTAVFGVEVGVPMNKAFDLSAVLPLAVLEHIRLGAGAQGLEPWAAGEDRVVVNSHVFTPVNWPNLARRAGEPDWQPPRYGFGWVELSAEERAEAIHHGEEEDARDADDD
jgi:hypothetical protein